MILGLLGLIGTAWIVLAWRRYGRRSAVATEPAVPA